MNFQKYYFIGHFLKFLVFNFFNINLSIFKKYEGFQRLYLKSLVESLFTCKRKNKIILTEEYYCGAFFINICIFCTSRQIQKQIYSLFSQKIKKSEIK
jgi:hypothetical protein